MAFPTLLDVTIQLVILVVGAPIVYLLSKILKLRPQPLTITEPRKVVFMVMIAVFVVVSASNVFQFIIFGPPIQLDEPTYDVIDVLYGMFFYAIFMIPLIIAMKRTRQNYGGIGITGKSKGRVLALGLILSSIFLIVSGVIVPFLGGSFRGFSSSLIYGFILFAINSSSEEIVWRGYIQTRLVAYSNTLKGLVLTSLLFALWHFPRLYYEHYGVVLEVMAGVLLRLPVSLLFGYIMVRSQNIIPSSIFHLFYNWNLILWQTQS